VPYTYSALGLFLVEDAKKGKRPAPPPVPVDADGEGFRGEQADVRFSFWKYVFV
jgi:hypothetical protein